MAGMKRSALLVAAACGLLLTMGERLPAADQAAGLTWEKTILVASGNAYRGPWRMNESVFDFVDDPTVAMMPDGDIAVAWVDHARKDVLFRRYGPNGHERWSGPVNVSRTPEIFSWLPRLAVKPGEPGELYALWQEIVFSGGTHGGEIFFARSSDGGRSFGAPRNLSRTRAGAGKGRLTRNYWHNGSLDLAIGPQGTLYAAWTEYEGPLRVARSTDGGQSFGEPHRVAGGPGRLPARGPTLAVGADGTVHLAWTVGGDVDADIRYARSDDGAVTFSRPRRIAPADGHADAPKLALDADGTLHLVYAYSASGPLGRYEVRYTRMRGGDRAFEPPRTLSAPLPEGFVGAAFPYLATAGDGRLYVACELFRQESGRHPRGLALMRSNDGGDTFTAPAVIPGTADPAAGFSGSQQGLLMRKLDAGRAGELAVVNSTFKAGEASRIRLYRAHVAAGSAGDTGAN